MWQWLLGLFLVVWVGAACGLAQVPEAPEIDPRSCLLELAAVGRAASDVLQGVDQDSREFLAHFRRPDPFAYQPFVKELVFRALAVKGRIGELKGSEPLKPGLSQAADLAEAGASELQRGLDQLARLADLERAGDPDQRERLLATLDRARQHLKQLEQAVGRLSDRPASPPLPTPPRS